VGNFIRAPVTRDNRWTASCSAAYDLASSGEAFFVGIAYGLAGGSIYFTAHVITNLCSNRFRLEIIRIVQSRIDKVWASAILLALLINILVGASASKTRFFLTAAGFAAGYGRRNARRVRRLVRSRSNFLEFSQESRLSKFSLVRDKNRASEAEGIFLRPVSAGVETNDPAKLEV